MNRFEAAGFRVRRQEMLRKGWPAFYVARSEVPPDAKQGDIYLHDDYIFTVTEDPDEQNMAQVHAELDPGYLMYLKDRGKK